MSDEQLSAPPSAAAAPVYYISALLPSSTPRWGTGAVGTSASVTYSFLTASPSYAGSDDAYGFAAANDAQKTAFRQALAAWAAVANVTFTEATDSSSSQIRIGTNDQGGVSSGYAYYPGGNSGGDVYIANDLSSMSNPTTGSFGYSTVVHELGHALGLKHPGNYNAGGGGTEGPYLPSAEDSAQYTTMSYNDHPTLGSSVQTTGPQLYDIAAVQYLYGANTSYNTGSNVYSFNSRTEAYLTTIWDGGGTDAIDASGQSLGSIINLNAGSFSSIGVGSSRSTAASNNVAIAYGATIENAVGGSGNDTIYGNSANNTLTGGAGFDILVGGDGTDAAVFSGARESYTVRSNSDGSTSVIATASGEVDTLYSIETLIFSDVSVSIGATTTTTTTTGSTGQDVMYTPDSGGATTVASGQTILVGGAGVDVVTLGAGGHTILLRGLETLFGSAGIDRVTIGDTGTTTTVGDLETLIGGAGTDIIFISSAGGAMTLGGVEILVGGAGTDAMTMMDGGQTLTLRGVETLTGGAGSDVAITGDTGTTMTVAGALEILVGGGGTDVVTLGGSGQTMILRGLETLTGSSGSDVAITGDTGTTMTVAGALEILVGGGGTDVITLGGSGQTMVLRGLETLTGSSGSDVAITGDTGTTMAVAGALEILVGGAGTDVITLGGSGQTVLLRGLETLTGGAGVDRVTIGDTGTTMTVTGLETLIGGAGSDLIFTGPNGGAMTVGGVEILVGGAGVDVVTLAAGGQQLLARGLETLIGSSSVDVLTLGDTSNTLTVSGVETVVGGANRDVVSIGSGAVRFQGGGGADSIALAANGAADQIVFNNADDGGSAGANSGYDTITGFASGEDQLVLSGSLRSLLDRNGDGSANAVVRANGGVNMRTDEVAVLSTTSSSLTPSNLTNVREAIGTLSNSSAGAAVLALVNDGSNTGAYIVVDSNGDGSVGATEIRMLGLFFSTSSISTGTISYG